MWPGGSGQCNLAHAPNRPIKSAHYSSFLDSELLAALTLAAVPLAASLLFLEIPHQPTLSFSLDSSSLYIFTIHPGPLFVSQFSFPLQVWPDLEWNQDFPDSSGELLRPLTRSCFLLLLLALSFLIGTCLSSLWSPYFLLHAPVLIPLSLAKVRLCSFSFWQRWLQRFCQLLSLWHWGHLFLSVRPLCLCLSAEACAILHALCWSRHYQQVCHFSSLLLSVSRSVLANLSSPPSFPLPQSLW